jgi:protein ImuB
VGIAADDPPETLLIDITATASCFGGEAALVEQALRDCVRARLTVRAAVANTIGAAWGLAHYGEINWSGMDKKGGATGSARANREPTLESRTAQRNSRCSVTLVAALDAQSVSPLHALPLAALRLPAAVLELLDSLGLCCIGDVVALPRDALVSRFGEQLPLRLDQMFGAAEEPIISRVPAPEYVAHRLLEYPARGRESVDLLLQPLVADVARQLADRRYGALAIAFRLALETAPAAEFTVSLFAPTADARHLWQLVELQLERLRLRAPVIAATVTVTSSAMLEHRQQSLLDEAPPRDDPRPLAALVERLTNRLGRAAALRVKQVPDAQPEYAVRLEPIVGRRGKSRSVAGKKKRTIKRRIENTSPAETIAAAAMDSVAASPGVEHGPGRLGRPLRLLSPPAMLEVLSIVPDGPPLRFRFRGKDHQVARFWGPERIETGWRRHQPVWRDYYRVETTTGAWFWLFRRRDDGRWRLHGEFE